MAAGARAAALPHGLTATRLFWEARADLWCHLVDSGSALNRPGYLAAQLVHDYLPKGAAVLDVGCGVGLLVSELLAAGHDAYGCDIALAMVRRARERAGLRGLDARQRFRPCSASRLPFERTFDAVTALGVLEYTRDWDEFLRLLSRHLAPDGTLIASCINPRSLSTYGQIAGHLARFRRGPDWPAVWRNLWRTGLWSGGCLEAPAGRRPAGPARFERLLREHGYTLLERLDLYHLGWRWPDAGPRRRRALGRVLARACGWIHLVVARRGAAVSG